MSLDQGLAIARSSLEANAKTLSTTARNIASAGVGGYTRLTTPQVFTSFGVSVLEPVRRENDALFSRVLMASGLAGAEAAVSEGLDGLQQAAGAPSDGRSPAAAVGRLRAALIDYAAAPDNDMAGQALVVAGKRVAEALREASDAVSTVRASAEQRIAASAAQIRDSLQAIERLNSQIVYGTKGGRDVSAALNERDRILSDLSGTIGIRVSCRADNGVAIYTDSGVTLFDVKARSVEYITKSADRQGSILIDGVDVLSPTSVMPLTAGRLAGEVKLRDEITVAFQAQLDELARSLVQAFGETNQMAPGDPPQPGLFAWRTAGFDETREFAARELIINPNVDPAAGGKVDRLRDGGASDPGNPAFLYNPSGYVKFADRLRATLAELEKARSFDPAAQLGSDVDAIAFSARSTEWLARLGAESASRRDVNTAMLSYAHEARTRDNGVSIDEELTRMMDLERSYQATARVMSVIERMYDSLMTAVGRA